MLHIQSWIWIRWNPTRNQYNAVMLQPTNIKKKRTKVKKQRAREKCDAMRNDEAFGMWRGVYQTPCLHCV